MHTEINRQQAGMDRSRTRHAPHDSITPARDALTARQIRSQDGRAIGLTGMGDPLADRLVLFCHPSPGTGAFDPDPSITLAWGVHFIGLDRPGYGGSDPLPHGTAPTFSGHADDLADFIERSLRNAHEIEPVNFGQIGIVGWGTGGLVALALAARHPHLVDRVAVLDTPAPKSFPPEVMPGPPYGASLLGIAPDDPVLRTTSLEHRLERMLQSAGSHGDAGARFDHDAYTDRDWIDDLKRNRAEVLLIYGEEHPTTSADSDGRWYQRRVPGSRVIRVQNGRAVSIITQWRKILDHVAPKHGDVPSRRRR